MGSIRLITFNIAHGRGLSFYQGFHTANGIHNNLKKITKVLNDAEADFVAMQEVDGESYWNKNINLLDAIRSETHYHHSHLGINNIREGRQNLSYGNALLSRHPIRLHHNQPFGVTSIGGKGFQYAEFEVAGTQIPLINIHLDFRSRLRRIAQIDQVIDFIESRTDPMGNGRLLPIICGDFNCPAKRAGDAVHHLFDYLEKGKHYTLLPNNVRTFPSFFPTRAIDFVFMPHRYRVTHVKVLPVFVSDHRPVLVEFEVDDARELRVSA